MSIIGENNAFARMMGDERIMDKLCLGNEIIFMHKNESDMDSTTIDHKDIIIGSEELMDENFELENSNVYYNEESNTFEEIQQEYTNNSLISPNFCHNGSIREIEKDLNNIVYNQKNSLILSSQKNNDLSDNEESDEETIATFLTAAGQQLALYAVENSDEIFAVAVYDETGVPPTNFQFLLKSDVEKLIGEGAVRTVKKPSQLKKQHYDIDPTPIVPQKKFGVTKTQSSISNTLQNSKKSSEIGINNYSNRNIISQNTILMSNADDSIDDCRDIVSNSSNIKNQYESSVIDNREIVEQSTVQYIFQDDAEDTSDLTLDDIEQLFSTPSTDQSEVDETKRLSCIPISSVSTPEKKMQKKLPQILNNNVSLNSSTYMNLLIGANSHSNQEPQTTIMVRSVTSTAEDTDCIESISPKGSLHESPGLSRIKRSRKQQLVVVNRADSEIIIQPASLINQEYEDEGRRPIKKRGRRKRKRQDFLLKDNPTIVPTLRKRTSLAKKYARHSRRIEVIDIDVENEEETVGQRNQKKIDEITIDEGKEKGSSDKENDDVIMVGDSDDNCDDDDDEDEDDDDDDDEEEEEESEDEKKTKKTALSHFKCQNCSRSFRQKRAVDTHSRVCQKSPTTRRKIAERSGRTGSTRSTRSNTSSDRSFETSSIKKQYACKVCNEKFEVVVALARHARLMHSLKKKSNSINSEVLESPTITPTKIKNSEIRRLPDSLTQEPSTKVNKKLLINEKLKKRKRGKTSLHSNAWKSKEMDCSDCGRWFPSATLLSAHSLQHATKKSVAEKQSRRCRICNKILASQLIYVRHMKMHTRKKHIQKTLRHMNQSTSKITPIRKPGRPKKF